MTNDTLISHSLHETLELGKSIGRLAQPGDVYLLVGNLGAGKTALTQGIAYGLGSEEYALSPTFVLMREIQGRLKLYHIDLYRLDHIEEIADLGLDDYFYGQGISVVEWADKGLSVLPPEHLLVNIDFVSDNERRFEFIAHGRRYEELISGLKNLSKVQN
jgi:tRNA threonylcarbamoyladenosine biosynthesis protein TsaE